MLATPVFIEYIPIFYGKYYYLEICNNENIPYKHITVIIARNYYSRKTGLAFLRKLHRAILIALSCFFFFFTEHILGI